MESPGKKFTDLVEIESIQDTDLAVVRNDTGVKKTPMQKLSDYIKQKFIGWVFSDLPTTDKTIPGALKEQNSALALLSGIRSTLTNGGVEFTSRVYQAGEAYVDGTANTDRCEIMYLRIYSQSDRSLLIGTMVSTSEDDWWSKYVASGTVLVTKNIGSEWYGWVSLSSAKG